MIGRFVVPGNKNKKKNTEKKKKPQTVNYKDVVDENEKIKTNGKTKRPKSNKSNKIQLKTNIPKTAKIKVTKGRPNIFRGSRQTLLQTLGFGRQRKHNRQTNRHRYKRKQTFNRKKYLRKSRKPRKNVNLKKRKPKMLITPPVYKLKSSHILQRSKLARYLRGQQNRFFRLF